MCSISHNYRILSTIAENAPALSCPGVLPCLFNNGDRLSGDAYRKINRRKASTAGHKTHIIVASNNETSTKSRYLWKMQTFFTRLSTNHGHLWTNHSSWPQYCTNCGCYRKPGTFSGRFQQNSRNFGDFSAEIFQASEILPFSRPFGCQGRISGLAEGANLLECENLRKDCGELPRAASSV